MPLIDWDDSYSVSVAEIDGQHKQLVAMINQLHQAMLTGQNKQALSGIISGLASYAGTHFALEEKYFEKFNYLGSAMHKFEHQNFVKKVKEFQTQFDSGKAMLSLEVMDFLKNWLLNHIKVQDKKYSKCFNENGLK